MLDQCHNIEPKIPAMIRSVMTLQETFARALLVDTATRCAPPRKPATCWRRTGSSRTPSRPMSARCWPSFGASAACRGSYRAYLDSGEPERRAAERVGGVAASW